MSQSSFPTSTSGVFIPSLWETAGGAGGDLTRAQADARYLKFPTGQGTETIPALVVTGATQIQSSFLTSNTNNTSYNSKSTAYTGANNCFFGYSTGSAITTGTDNCGFGQSLNLPVLDSGSNNSAFGTGALKLNTSGSSNTAIGYNTGALTTSGNNNVCIGASAVTAATISTATAIGASSSASATDCTAIGASSNAFGASTVAIGKSAIAQGASSIAIGTSASAGLNDNCVAIGVSSTAGSSGVNATAIGYTSAAGGANATALGHGTIANGTNGTAVGHNATTGTFTKSTAIGKDAAATASNQVVLGTSTETVIIPRTIRYLNSPMLAYQFNSSTQSLTNNAEILVNFPTADARNGTATGLTYSAGTFTNSNSYSVTLNIVSNISFAANATGIRVLWINTSGQGKVGTFYYATTSAAECCVCGSAIAVLNAGETLNISAYQNSGGALNIGGSTNLTTRVSVMVF
jgi:hypothetical protein